MTRLILILLAGLLTGCQLAPKAETLLGVARAKATALPLAFELQSCVTDTPAEVEFAPHFNAVLDFATKYRNVKVDSELVKAIPDARDEVAAVAQHWRDGTQVLREYGVQCSPFVKQEAANVVAVYEDLLRVYEANERVVFWGEVAYTTAGLFGVLPGRALPEVKRMEVSQ